MENTRFLPLGMSDAESLRIWRNDQIDALRQSQYLSSAAQKKFKK